MNLAAPVPVVFGTRRLWQNILTECDLHQVWAFHNPDSRRMRSGWPDLALLGATRSAFREIKGAREQVSERQYEVGNRLLEAGEDWSIWRPRHWTDGTIRRQLGQMGGPPTRLVRPPHAGIRLRISTADRQVLMEQDSVHLHCIAQFAQKSECNLMCPPGCMTHGWADLFGGQLVDGTTLIVEMRPEMLSWPS